MLTKDEMCYQAYQAYEASVKQAPSAIVMGVLARMKQSISQAGTRVCDILPPPLPPPRAARQQCSVVDLQITYLVVIRGVGGVLRIMLH
jgi:hypothetical protein